MHFQLSPMEEADIPAFILVDKAAMANWPLAKALAQPGKPRQVIVENFMREGWGKDPTAHWLKIMDTDAGEMVAAALWKFELEGERSTGKSSEQDNNSTKSDSPAVPSVWEEMGRIAKDFKNEFIGGRPHAVLSILETHPNYQRRGAGSILVKWGCDKADEYGIPAILQASEAGQGVYTKHGFEVKKVVEMDLKPYGFDVMEMRRGMIRKPQSG